MAITTVLFDLDGTLLPMDQETFVKAFFGLLANHFAPHGYDPKVLINAIWAGTKAMVVNNGEKTNERVFWDVFCGLTAGDRSTLEPLLREFYEVKFPQARAACGSNPKILQVMDLLKQKGLRRALATNPLFPAVATDQRIRWTGLVPEDFELFTAYENASYSKPNPDYYREVAAMLNVPPEECVMVGNDVAEDMVARELGMEVFLITDCIINKNNEDISCYPHGNFDDLMAWLETL